MSASRLRGAISVTVLDAVVLLILAGLFGGVHLRDFGTALAAAVLVGLSNALLWPAISRAALPLNVLTLGLAGLLLNGLLFGAVIDLLPGAEIDGFGEAVVLTLILTASTATVESLLAERDAASPLEHCYGHPDLRLGLQELKHLRVFIAFGERMMYATAANAN